MVDITPFIPGNRKLIQSYGDGCFRISGVVHAGSVVVFPTLVMAWEVPDPAVLTMDSLEALTSQDRPVQVLLLGCGPKMIPVAPELRQALRRLGIVVESMDTGAACRTYNVLMSEDRLVAAALVAV